MDEFRGIAKDLAKAAKVIVSVPMLVGDLNNSRQSVQSQIELNTRNKAERMTTVQVAFLLFLLTFSVAPC